MNTEHLFYILEAYKCRSVNKAAKNSFISQSHLSNIIKNAEEEIGYVLFRRTSSGITPTPEGKLFMDHAEKIITEHKNILRIPESITRNNNLSVFCSRSSYVLQCFIDFKNKYPCPNLSDTFLEAGLKETLKGIVAQSCRLGILVMFESRITKYKAMAEQYSLAFSPLKKDIQAMAFMSAKHPLAAGSTVTIAEMAQYPFVADSHIDYDDTLAILGIPESQNILYICDRGTTFDAVRKGNYISVGVNIPPKDAKMYGCVCRPITNSGPMAICLIRSDNYPLSPRERQFVKYLKEELNSFFV